MTPKQKQWQLFYLGYYGETTDDIDGLWGAQSEAATKAFQSAVGIKDDGIFGDHTRDKTMEMISAIQEIVAPYAKKPLVEDGLAGPATMAATVWYQKETGLTPDGIAGDITRRFISTDESIKPIQPEDSTPDKVTTGTFWDDIVYFTRAECKCKCGGRYCNGYPAEMKERVMRIADAARKHFNAPADVISALRCQRHNANEGGVANSQHMYGEAMDIRIRGVSSEALYRFIISQPGVRYAYKINDTNVHFDIPKGSR